MLSLFADQEREAKLDSLGDPLALLNNHVDFRLMAEEIDRWVPRPSRAKGTWRSLMNCAIWGSVCGAVPADLRHC